MCLPSYVFIPLLPQLSARLRIPESVPKSSKSSKSSSSSSKSASSSTSSCDDNLYVDQLIYDILKKCAIDHPHHTLNQIMALVKTNDDQQFSSQPGERHQTTPADSRGLAALKLLKDLKQHSPYLKEAITQLDRLATNMIEYAYKDLDKPKSGPYECKNKLLTGLKALNHVHCPTVDLPISIDGQYNRIVSIESYNSSVQLMPGVNAPKKLRCLCSDGVERLQLLKGNDDLRQDAVMQQVFNIMNEFLSKNATASEQRLNVCTYKVIPFSKRSGMLEWCANTKPLGEVLRYFHECCRKVGMPLSEARSMIGNAAGKSADEKHRIYRKICKDVRPQFQHFFLHFYTTPGIWFERKMAYTNSVATNSIIGYILGIGDRHVNK